LGNKNKEDFFKKVFFYLSLLINSIEIAPEQRQQKALKH
jgi:hypothetical protein